MKWAPRILLAILALASVSSVLHAQDDVAKQELLGKQKNLEDVKRQIRVEKKEVRAIEKKETGILDELQSINRSISRRRRELSKLKASLSRLDKKIDAANKSISRLEARKRELFKRLGARLKAMYVMGRGETMDLIFSSATSAELARRHKYLTVIMDYDSTLISEYESNLKELGDQKAGLAELKSRISVERASSLENKREAERLRGRKLAILRGVRRKKDEKQKSVAELEQAAKELSDLIGRLGVEGGGDGSGFSSMKGRLLRPVEGKVVSTYGRVTNPRFRTVTFNNGIVISAPVGTPVKSVYKGKVVYVGWLKGYGQVMIIDHSGGFYTLFAYLSEVLLDKGGTVDKGTEIGLVGDTGPLAYGGLYFEIRQKGVPRDPMAWLGKK